MRATLRGGRGADQGRLRGDGLLPPTTRSRAKRLEEMGCVAIMPLGAPIGSGLGIQNAGDDLDDHREQTKVPLLVDAGVGTASDAAIAMELGCDAVLLNSRDRPCQGPDPDGAGHEAAIEAGRLAYLAGRMPRQYGRRPVQPAACRGDRPELSSVCSAGACRPGRPTLCRMKRGWRGRRESASPCNRTPSLDRRPAGRLPSGRPGHGRPGAARGAGLPRLPWPERGRDRRRGQAGGPGRGGAGSHPARLPHRCSARAPS